MVAPTSILAELIVKAFPDRVFLGGPADIYRHPLKREELEAYSFQLLGYLYAEERSGGFKNWFGNPKTLKGGDSNKLV